MRFELQVIPSVDSYSHRKTIETAIGVIAEAGLEVSLTSVGAAINGTWDEVMPILKEVDTTLRSELPEVTTTLRISSGGTETSEDAVVEEASEESFAASDAPSFTPR